MSEESKLAEKLEEKTSDENTTEEQQFSDEDLKSLKEIQDKYLSNQASFGHIKVAKIRVTQELDAICNREEELENEFSKLQKEEIKFMDEMTKKYGDGQLNPTTGVFVPNKSE